MADRLRLRRTPRPAGERYVGLDDGDCRRGIRPAERLLQAVFDDSPGWCRRARGARIGAAGGHAVPTHRGLVPGLMGGRQQRPTRLNQNSIMPKYALFWVSTNHG